VQLGPLLAAGLGMIAIDGDEVGIPWEYHQPHDLFGRSWGHTGHQILARRGSKGRKATNQRTDRTDELTELSPAPVMGPASSTLWQLNMAMENPSSYHK